jgi:hypothetical protein
MTATTKKEIRSRAVARGAGEAHVVGEAGNRADDDDGSARRDTGNEPPSGQDIASAAGGPTSSVDKPSDHADLDVPEFLRRTADNKKLSWMTAAAATAAPGPVLPNAGDRPGVASEPNPAGKAGGSAADDSGHAAEQAQEDAAGQRAEMVKRDLKTLFKKDPKYSKHMRKDVPGMDVKKYGNRGRTS